MSTKDLEQHEPSEVCEVHHDDEKEAKTRIASLRSGSHGYPHVRLFVMLLLYLSSKEATGMLTH